MIHERVKMEKIKRIEHRIDIQVLRGIAVISVILFHIDKTIFKYGYIGVDIFFVISGFVISNLIYSNLSNNSFKLREFIFMRFKRIVPALVSYLLFVQVVLFFNVDHQNVIENTKTSFYSLLLLANVHISQYLEYFTQDSTKNLVINLWSLSVEEQFYIIFPIFVLLLRKIKILNQLIIYLGLIILSIISINQLFFESLNIFQKVFLNYQNYVFYSPITRIWEFILGVIGMFLNQEKVKKKYFPETKNLGLILYSLLFFSMYSNVLIFNNLTRLIFSNLLVFLILICNFDLLFKNISYFKFLIFTGNISYSLYLFHQGVLAGIRNHNHFSTSESIYYLDLNNFITLLIVIGFIYFVSTINFYLIENKFRKIKTPSIKGFRSFILLLLLTVSSMSLSINTNGFSFRHTDLISFNIEKSNIEYVNGSNYLIQDGKQCLNRSISKNFCKFQINDNNKQVYIAGDSMMSSLVGGFLENKISENYTIIEATKGGCALLLDTCDFFEGSNRHESFSNTYDSIFILGGKYQNHLNENTKINDIKDSLVETIKLLTNNGNEVYLLTPIPEPQINERMYYFKNSKYLNHDYREWKESVSEISNMLNQINTDDFYLIKLDKLFCDENKCNFKSDKHYYFLDHVHFSYYGSKYVANEVIKFIEEKN